MPPGGGPPPPPPLPGAGLPKKPAGIPPIDGLLSDIRGGARLKKVSDAEKRDRSMPIVPGAEPAASPAASGGGGGGGGDGGGLAGALASALAARKSKVSHSDDEDDKDDWD